MTPGVVAEHIPVAQLAQQRRPVGRADLAADQEEGGIRVVALEHREERGRVRGGTVIEAECDLAPGGTAAIGAAVAATADDAIHRFRGFHARPHRLCPCSARPLHRWVR